MDKKADLPYSSSFTFLEFSRDLGTYFFLMDEQG